jgi:D-tyrosyl-tRNA(Tyr) deacylase
MRALVQRVSRCSVRVDDRVISQTGKGLLVLLGVCRDDSEKEAAYIVNKVLNLRIFDDDEGKMNLSLVDVKGELMVVSQFTLYADTRKGRRPSYVQAALPDRAEELYERVCEGFAQAGFEPGRGIFGAYMLVELENDGPVTILLESPASPSLEL